MAYTILPKRELRELEGISNGQIPDSLLVDIGPSGKLLNTPARCWTAMAFVCAGQGLNLTWTYGGTYRDFRSQFNLFISRYEQCTSSEYYATPSSRRKYWPGGPFFSLGIYWRKKLINGRYPATAATPGSSNHGLGIAVDVAYDSNPADGVNPAGARYIGGAPQWEFFQQKVLEFGFSWELQSEPWHIRYVNGDAVPEVVVNVERFLNYGWVRGVGIVPRSPVEPTPPPPPPPEEPTPEPLNWTEQLVYNLPTLRPGTRNGMVRRMQGLLVANGREVIIDGDFGNQTEVALNNFKRAHGLEVNGVCGRGVWIKLLGR